nr:hypothetical protein [Evansella caseinilytica]
MSVRQGKKRPATVHPCNVQMNDRKISFVNEADADAAFPGKAAPAWRSERSSHRTSVVG